MTNKEFENYVQNKVNEVAQMLIEKCPDIAENNPKQIGAMAKKMVNDALVQAATN